MSQSVNVLLLLEEIEIEPVPTDIKFWIDNLGNKFKDNLGNLIVFNPG